MYLRQHFIISLYLFVDLYFRVELRGREGGEIVVSERWVVPTNIVLKKGGVGEGGAVELWERRIDGGLCFGLKVEPLSCDLCVGERWSVVCILEEGEGRAC